MSAELGTQKKEPLLAPLPTNIKYLMEIGKIIWNILLININVDMKYWYGIKQMQCHYIVINI